MSSVLNITCGVSDPYSNFPNFSETKDAHVYYENDWELAIGENAERETDDSAVVVYEFRDCIPLNRYYNFCGNIHRRNNYWDCIAEERDMDNLNNMVQHKQVQHKQVDDKHGMKDMVYCNNVLNIHANMMPPQIRHFLRFRYSHPTNPQKSTKDTILLI